MKRTATWLQHRIVHASFTFALLMIVVMVKVAWADDPFGDDGGGDPFGGGKDPFGDPDVDEKEREQRRKVAEQRKREQIAVGLRERALELAQSMARERDDAWCLERSLALLNDGWHHHGVESFDEFLGRLEYVAGHSWRTFPDETPETALVRIQRDFQADRHETAKQYRKRVKQFIDVSGKPCPLDWRAENELWFDVVATIIRSHDVEDSSLLWRAKMKEDPKNQLLYRYCYVALVRQGEVKKLDYDLIKPMLDKHRTDSLVDLAWQARVLHTYAAARVPVDHPERVAVRNLFLKNLKSLNLKPRDFARNYFEVRAIGQFCDVADRKLERRLVLGALAANGLEGLRYFSRLAAVSDAELRDIFLARETKLDCDDMPLRKAIQSLDCELFPGLIIDDAVWEDIKPVSLKMTGTWLDVTEALLEKTEYRFVPLGRDMFWLGKPEGAKRLGEMIVRGQETTAFAGERATAALHDETNLEFIATPVIDVSEYLQDLHDLPIQVFGDIAEKPVTLDIKGIPLYLGMELICADLKISWGTIGEAVIFAPEEEMNKLDALKKERLRRLARLRHNNGKVAEALHDDIHLEFIETPLADVIDNLSDLHNIPLRVVDMKVLEKPITMNLRGISFDLALDLMMFKHGLAWHTDGKEIVIGSEKEIEALCQKTLMD